MPIVSVITATRNRSRWLREAIASVQAQTLADWEHIIVDDGSTDDTRAVVEALAARDARIRYVYHAPRRATRAAAAARNVGLRLARGTYLAFLDDDDRYLPHKLSSQVEQLERHPAWAFVYAPMWLFRDADPTRIVGRAPEGVLDTTYTGLIERSPIQIPTILVRRARVEEAGLFDETLSSGEGMDLWRRIARRCPFGATDEPVALYRIHGNNVSKNLWIRHHNRLRTLARVPADPGRGLTRALLSRTRALAHYRTARVCIETYGRYAHAATHFLRAVALHPLVGLEIHPIPRSRQEAVVRFVKPYAAIPYCLMADPFHLGRRKHSDHLRALPDGGASADPAPVTSTQQEAVHPHA
jgi:glycosyltransferase involved in cell wall biosynthesis